MRQVPYTLNEIAVAQKASEREGSALLAMTKQGYEVRVRRAPSGRTQVRVYLQTRCVVEASGMIEWAAVSTSFEAVCIDAYAQLLAYRRAQRLERAS